LIDDLFMMGCLVGRCGRAVFISFLFCLLIRYTPSLARGVVVNAHSVLISPILTIASPTATERLTPFSNLSLLPSTPEFERRPVRQGFLALGFEIPFGERLMGTVHVVRTRSGSDLRYCHDIFVMSCCTDPFSGHRKASRGWFKSFASKTRDTYVTGIQNADMDNQRSVMSEQRPRGSLITQLTSLAPRARTCLSRTTRVCLGSKLPHMSTPDSRSRDEQHVTER
jgi:hypothetical protein